MIYMFLANGFEEVEALAPADVLRRAGIDVVLVGVGGEVITGSHGVSVVCNMTDSDFLPNTDMQGIFLPGGMPGTVNLEKSPVVSSAIDHCLDNGLLICAICAAPSILGHKGILEGKKAVCFPGFEEELFGAQIPDSCICEDGNILTAKGMGSAVEFGIRIAARLAGESKAKAIRSSLQIYHD